MLLRFAEDGTEPADHHRHQHAKTGQHQPRPRGIRVEPERRAEGHQQKRARAGDRPVRGLRHEVVGTGAVLRGAHFAPSTAKNVYESVIVRTWAGNLGSTTTTTSS